MSPAPERHPDRGDEASRHERTEAMKRANLAAETLLRWLRQGAAA